MLRISQTKDDAGAFTLKLEGQIRGQWVDELRLAADLASREHTQLALDLGEVSYIDSDGVALLRRLAARGVSLTNCSPFSAAQLHEVRHDE